MSWDVIIVNSLNNEPIEELWEENKIPSFGSTLVLQKKINSVYSETDWTDPTYGHLDNGIYVGHFSLSKKDEQNGTFTLHVYGGSNPLELITTLCKTFNWSAYDTSTSEYIDPKNPSNKGWKEFVAFRQRIIENVGGQVGGQSKYKMKTKRWWQIWR